MSGQKKVQVTDEWKKLAQKKTWIDIFEETADRFPDNAAILSGSFTILEQNSLEGFQVCNSCAMVNHLFHADLL